MSPIKDEQIEFVQNFQFSISSFPACLCQHPPARCLTVVLAQAGDLAQAGGQTIPNELILQITN